MKRDGLILLIMLAIPLCPLLASCVAPTPTREPRLQPMQAAATVMPKLRDPLTLVLWHAAPEGSPEARLLGLALPYAKGALPLYYNLTLLKEARRDPGGRGFARFTSPGGVRPAADRPVHRGPLADFGGRRQAPSAGAG